jgi:hypothetical protein
MDQQPNGTDTKVEWVLEAKPAQDGQPEIVDFELALREKAFDQRVSVIRMRSGIDAFVAALTTLKSRLSEIEVEAREQFEQLIDADRSRNLGPGELWEQLAASASEKAMFELFNGFGEQTREAVAEYVFTRVSMFSGKGPLFAEHYNAANRILE